MVADCKGKTRSGARCQAPAGQSGFCYFHDPSMATVRAQARKMGGKARRAPKPSEGTPAPVVSDVASILGLVNQVIADVWALENTCPRARALLSAAAEARNALSIGEFEERLKALERAQLGAAKP